MSTQKAVVFDLDGVLVNSIHAHAYAYEQLFLPFGIEFGFERYATEAKGLARTEVIRQMLGDIEPQLFQELMVKKVDLTRKYIEDVGLKPIEGALEFVREVQGLGLKTAVATASREPALLLGAIGASELFEVVVDASMVEHAKPHPDVFLQALLRLNVPPSMALILEDSVFGVQAGVAAGATVYALSTTEERQVLTHAHRVFGGFAEINIQEWLKA